MSGTPSSSSSSSKTIVYEPSAAFRCVLGTLLGFSAVSLLFSVFVYVLLTRHLGEASFSLAPATALDASAQGAVAMVEVFRKRQG